jgi:hypothetical protein
MTTMSVFLFQGGRSLHRDNIGLDCMIFNSILLFTLAVPTRIQCATSVCRVSFMFPVTTLLSESTQPLRYGYNVGLLM